jgi:hypothetical protein
MCLFPRISIMVNEPVLVHGDSESDGQYGVCFFVLVCISHHSPLLSRSLSLSPPVFYLSPSHSPPSLTCFSQFNSIQGALLAWEIYVYIAKASEMDQINSKVNSKYYTHTSSKIIETFQMSLCLYTVL